MPELFMGLEKICEGRSIEKIYPTLPNVSIDYGVMEKTERLDIIAGDFDWCDVGDLVEFAKLSGQMNPHIEIDGKGSLVLGDGRMVATLGLDNLLIVQTPDAILVTTKDRAQDVRKVTAALKERDLKNLL
jgi:mannose-1-phosphate guanylyltransferase